MMVFLLTFPRKEAGISVMKLISDSERGSIQWVYTLPDLRHTLSLTTMMSYQKATH